MKATGKEKKRVETNRAATRRKEATNAQLPNIDAYSSRKDWENACWNKISRSGKSLSSLISLSERKNLVLRAVVMDRLRSGRTYRDIEKEVWSSPQTISEIKKAMQKGDYRSYRQRSKTERRRRPQYTSSVGLRERPEPPARRKIKRKTKYGDIYLP